MANKFKAGDIVVLKSGGPPMTVDKVPGGDRLSSSLSDSYHTIWFKGASRESGYFEEHLLKEFTPPEK